MRYYLSHPIKVKAIFVVSFTKDQNLVIENLHQNKLVIALPGSGKTHVSIGLAAEILKASVQNSLIMVTFTRASTNETSHRIAKAVPEEAMRRCRVDTFAKLMKDHAAPLAKGRRIVMGPQHEMLIRRAVGHFAKSARRIAIEYLRGRFHVDYLKHHGDVTNMQAAAQAYIKTLEQANKIDMSTL
ncbi:hypothetical protein C9975_09730, partial [Thalassospira xiamenensis]